MIIDTSDAITRWASLFFNLRLPGSCTGPQHRSRPLEEFDIDISTGFFPPKPLPHLPKTFEIWEQALEQAPDVLSLSSNEDDVAIEKRERGLQWRKKIEAWSVIDTGSIHHNKRLLQRAHLVLAWLLHFYVHSSTSIPNSTSITIPGGIAVPLVKVSQVLRIAPVLTFADTVLWNVEPINPIMPLSIENVQVMNCFSGTEDERNFYRTSAQVEMRGIEAISIIKRYLDLSDSADRQNIDMIARDLTRLARIIEDLLEIMQSVREGVNPKIFYWAVRPWFNGSDANGQTSSRWIYEGVPDADVVDSRGPSAGQSSVMHALDLFLGIDYKEDRTRCPIPSVRNKQHPDPGFMERMRRYMPGAHRDFLSHISEAPVSVRELAERTATLQEPYNSVVGVLKKLRDMHIRIACLYIVSMSNSRPLPGFSIKPQAEYETYGPALGTGGTEVSSLLKAGRDATRRALIE